MGDSVRDCKRVAETTESSTTCFAKKLKICFDFEELRAPLSNFELRNDCIVVDSSARPSKSGGALDGDPCSSSCSCFSQTSRCSSSKTVEECSRFVDREAKSFETEDSTSTCITSRLSREASPSSSDFLCAETNEMDSPVAEKSQPDQPVAGSPARPKKSMAPAKTGETEDSTFIASRLSREATPSSDFFCAETNEMDSPVADKSQPENTVETKMPSQEEIEAFFGLKMAAAEKLEQKRLMEKYNFDFENDVPLEGRYEWVRLK